MENKGVGGEEEGINMDHPPNLPQSTLHEKTALFT